MIKTEILAHATPSGAQLEEFMEYAGINGGCTPAYASGLLARAILKVQEMADKSIVWATIKVTDTEAVGEVQLYQTVDTITAVYVAGEETQAYQLKGNVVKVNGRVVSVIYETAPNDGDITELWPVVLQYATALYDGAPSAELGRILGQC